MTKHGAMQKLRSARTKLWLAPEFLTNEVLEDTYSEFPESNSTSFTKLWVQTRRFGRHLLGTKAGFLAHSLMESTALPYVQYVHLLNEVRLSVGALVPPLYYPEGTTSMLYGGLGFFYAKSLIDALDSEATRAVYTI
ncbi:hypothetical protein HPB52_007263 [Rhipicephalus sanguineus]|uniref:Uncharacterized protein n=1 Tax=Rhipicephalus sanguineus TaxID=34632 RepID=A0A9D4SQZ0_RHISA|nr:hypothetical protein HPB52_007263 [Rhipicephalus sanguineus]